MKRRNLLGALAAGMTGPTAAAVAATRADLDLTLSGDGADLGFWESTVARYGHGYSGHPPADVLANLVAELVELNPLMAASQTVAARARLCRVAAQMAGMIAIILHDLGDHRESARWFHSASRAAGESGDTDTHAWVLGREAMVPLNFGAQAVAIELAEKARALAGERPSSAAALACAVAARAYAASGRREEALAAVDHADRIMDQLPAAQSVSSWFGYPEQKHRVHLSQALTILGETQRAYAEQERALELSASPSVMTRALIAIDRASCLAKDGEPEEAARVAADAYDELPPSYRSGLTLARAFAVYRSVRGTHEGERLRDMLYAAA